MPKPYEFEQESKRSLLQSSTGHFQEQPHSYLRKKRQPGLWDPDGPSGWMLIVLQCLNIINPRQIHEY